MQMSRRQMIEHADHALDQAHGWARMIESKEPDDAAMMAQVWASIAVAQELRLKRRRWSRWL